MDRLQEPDQSTPLTSRRTKKILAIHEILSLLVPPELANLIMNYASLLGSIKFIFDATNFPRVITTSQGSPTPFWTAQCILLTDKLSIDTGFSEPRSVTFTIRSCAQGWGGYDGPSGVYGGSWTWFDAFIVRDADKSDDEVVSALRFTGSRREHIQFVLSDPMSGTTGEDGQAWEIQRNVRASQGRDVMHKVTWTLENEARWESDWDHQPSDNDTGRWDMKGHGGGTAFISSLRNEDRIAIVANARFPGWENYVTYFEMELFYAV